MDSLIIDELISLNRHMLNRVENPESIQFHLHDTYEVLFFISGNASYFVNSNSYPLKHGDLVITNTTEIHAPVFHSSDTYERIIFHFTPHMARYLSTPEFSLENCFIKRPNGKYNKTTLNDYQINEFMSLYREINHLNGNLTQGNVILKLGKLMELLVFINNAFSNQTDDQYPQNLPGPLIKVIDYINNNLSADLSLEELGKRYFLNKNYLCSLFKKYTGKTIHQYILYRRISYAKQLLRSGKNVTETCLLCGFNDYSNFVNKFGRITGETPGSYRKKAARGTGA